MTRLENVAVLIVDDEPLIALDLATLLEVEGATPIIAATASAALAMAIEHQVDAAVLEYKLQETDCNDLCEQLSERSIPFVIYTSWSNPVGACRCGPIVEKPQDASAVVNHLVVLTARHKARVSIGQTTEAS
jgi:DNA-binding response OmpR family regulator